MELESWEHLHRIIGKLSEDELRQTINYEASTYKRKTLLTRLHQRYTKMRALRERSLLLSGELLL